MDTKQTNPSVITNRHRWVLSLAFALALTGALYLSLHGDPPLAQPPPAEVWAWALFNGGWLLFCACDHVRSRRVSLITERKRS